VTIIVCVTPGSVNCIPSAAAEAKNAVTPGTTTDFIPFFSKLSICSLMAP
jgi:hypothetical protein